jgi:hypothetical protein
MYFYEDTQEAKECRQPYWAMVARDSRRFRHRIQKCELLLREVLPKKQATMVKVL